VDTSSLVGSIIQAIDTFACEPVHTAWVDANTTPIATSMAVVQLADGRLLLLAPQEVEFEPGKYPALGLGISECGPDARQWHSPSGKTYVMEPLAPVASLLPFAVESVTESDPLGEGPVSELAFVSPAGTSVIFRHIMPPMTLGIDFRHPGQAPNNSFKPKPLRGSA
jgi:hypothetical protein